MNKRGFLKRLAALVTAPFAAVVAAKVIEPETLHVRFTHSRATKIHWLDGEAYIECEHDAKDVEFDAYLDDGWRPEPVPGFVVLKR